MATDGTGASSAHSLWQGCKVSPDIQIKPGATFTLAEVSASGAIQHIWITITTQEKSWRAPVLRIYWDDEKEPFVETPFGDSLEMGVGEYARLNSLPGTGRATRQVFTISPTRRAGGELRWTHRRWRAG
jgi:hypothetical protein